MDIDDGGPAFPHDSTQYGRDGMSLRDWFAGQAMAGIAIKWELIESYLKRTGGQGFANDVRKFMADAAYAQADALLAARKQDDAQPAPQDAGERGDEVEMRRRGWEWDKDFNTWRKAIDNWVCAIWRHTSGTWNYRMTGARPGDVPCGQNYSSPLTAADVCEAYAAARTQPATLPWHDIGPGLSVAVVEGKGVYRVRQFVGGWAAQFAAGDGSLVCKSDYDTLAAAKSACDDHAKGGA